jgi:hypothetical protein
VSVFTTPQSPWWTSVGALEGKTANAKNEEAVDHHDLSSSSFGDSLARSDFMLCSDLFSSMGRLSGNHIKADASLGIEPMKDKSAETLLMTRITGVVIVAIYRFRCFAPLLFATTNEGSLLSVNKMRSTETDPTCCDLTM